MRAARGGPRHGSTAARGGLRHGATAARGGPRDGAATGGSGTRVRAATGELRVEGRDWARDGAAAVASSGSHGGLVANQAAEWRQPWWLEHEKFSIDSRCKQIETRGTLGITKIVTESTVDSLWTGQFLG